MSIVYQNHTCKVLEFPMEEKQKITFREVRQLDREHEENSSKFWRLLLWYALGCVVLLTAYKFWEVLK